MGCGESIESQYPNANLRQAPDTVAVIPSATKQKQQKPAVKPSQVQQDLQNPQDFFTSRNQDFNQGSPVRYFSRQEYLKNPKFSSKEDFNEQIVLLEPSPVEKKIKKLKNKGGAFTDDTFPPQLTSLIGVEDDDMPEDDQLQLFHIIQWARLTQLFQNPQIVKGRPKPHDIKQGQIGDCYFLAGLAALAEKPNRILNLFLNRQITNQKNIAVKLLFKGKFMTIDLDDYIPTIDGQPIFSAAEDGSLWVTLLEKAWAKLYTNYNRIQYGDCEQAIHDLTGAPIREVHLRDSNFDKEQQWKYLMEATRKQYAMVGGTPPTQNNKNIAGSHAYTLLKAVTVTVNKKQERLVLLRDPYGDGQQFVGKWSDFSQTWNSVSEEDKKRINYQPDQEDGLFWMSYDEFLKYFEQISIAQIQDKASYVYETIKDENSEGVYFILDIGKQGIYSLQIDRTPIRSYPKQQQNSFQFADVELMVGKIEDGVCNQWESIELEGDRTPYKKINFTPGSYAAYVRMYFIQQFQKDFEVNLAVYSPTACKIRAATQDQIANLSQGQEEGQAEQGEQGQEGEGQEGEGQEGEGEEGEEGEGEQEYQQGQQPQEVPQGQEGEQEQQGQQQPEYKPQKQKKQAFTIINRNKNSNKKNQTQITSSQQISISFQPQRRAPITRKQFQQMFPQPYPPPRHTQNSQVPQQSQQFTQVFRHQYQPRPRPQYSFAPQYVPQYPRQYQRP